MADAHTTKVIAHRWSLDETFRRINIDYTFVGIPQAVVRSSVSQWDRGHHAPDLA